MTSWPLNPSIPIYPATFANVSLKEILTSEAPAAPAPEESTNTVTTRPTSITLVTKEVADPEKLDTFVRTIACFTYRIKGFVKTTDGVKNVSLVGDECRIEAWDQPVDETRLVIISSAGIRIMSETLKAARSCYQNPIRLE